MRYQIPIGVFAESILQWTKRPIVAYSSLDMDDRMSCLRVPDVDGSLLLSAICCAEHASNLNAVLAVSTTNK